MIKEATYQDVYSSTRDSLPGGEPWVSELRDTALARFSDSGFPDPRRDEDWHYARLNVVRDSAYAPSDAAPDGADIATIADTGPLLVFMDGRFQAGHSRVESLGEGSFLLSLGQGLSDYAQFIEAHFAGDAEFTGPAALNSAMMRDGAIFHLRARQMLSEPLSVLHVAGDTAQAAHHLRNLIVLDAGAEATIIEQYAGGDADYWTNLVSTITVRDGAKLTHIRIQDEGASATHTAQSHVTIEGTGEYRAFTLMSGGAMARNEIRVALTGEGGHAQLDSVQLGSRGQRHDTMTLMNHAHPNCTSTQTVRNVVAAGASTAFSGRVHVAEGAIGTDAEQSAKSLLLDRTAEANTKPELEIFADDVKCAHGATVGELDANALFYLESRGLSPADAKALLTEAFVAGVVEGFELGELGEAIAARTALWIDAALEGAGS